MTGDRLPLPTALIEARPGTGGGHGSGWSPCRVSVCRGCCCGNSSKHPETDHDFILNELQRQLEGSAQVQVVSCLFACDRSSVVVINPSPAGRRSGGRPAYIESVHGETVVRAIAEWITAGGPGIATPPTQLADRMTLRGLRSQKFAHIPVASHKRT